MGMDNSGYKVSILPQTRGFRSSLICQGFCVYPARCRMGMDNNGHYARTTEDLAFIELDVLEGQVL